MNFGISLEFDADAYVKSKIVRSLSDNIKDYLKGKNYGEVIQHFFIGCICIKTRPGYEKWYKARKPRYKETDNIKLLDGSVKELIGVFTYDIKLDYEKFVNSSDNDSEKLIVLELLNSFSNFDSLPKKVKNFDKNSLKSDLEYYFKQQNLI
jgi:Immunity protein 44